MHRLRDSILSLLIFVAILFNIERLDIGGKNVINLETAIYVLIVIMIIMIISVKWLQTVRQPFLITLSTAIYFAVKLVLISRRPLVGGIYTYLSFTELGFLTLAVFLAQNLALNIKDFEQAVENFAFANLRKVKPIDEAEEEIQAEIYRSRRFQRPLSIIMLEQDSKRIQKNINKLVEDTQRAIMERYTSVMIAKELTTQLRRTDLLLENGKKDRLIILSPETDLTEAETLISRLKSLNQTAEFPVNFGTATFPDHALTFEQLLEFAEVNLQRRVDNQIDLNSLGEVEVSEGRTSTLG
jgi:hypothetical protein